MATRPLDALLKPRSIAMIGASNNASRIGGMPLELMQRFGYKGDIFPINPKYQEAFGIRCYPDIESVPAVPDLAVLAVPAAEVTPMLRRCQGKGVAAAIVYASGFSEAGAEGLQLQTELEEFARRTGMIIAGPNCMGFANLNHHIYTAFASVFKNVPVQDRLGRVSLLTQSGNVCSALFAQLRRIGVTVSHFVNTGNEACLEFSQYLQYMAADDETDAVVGYIEQLRDGQRFIEVALEFARRGKPLILFKAGESDKGSEAVRSHTSALAGHQAFYRAAFRQLNVLHADDFAQMADLAWLSGFRQRQGGRRVAILSISGALGAIIADRLIAAGHQVPTLPPEVQKILRAGIPTYGMVANPVDLTGNVVNNPEFVQTIFAVLATTPSVDTVIVYAPGYLLDRMAGALEKVCREHNRLFVAIDTGAATCGEQLAHAGVPMFSDLGRAMRALEPYLHWLSRRAEVEHWITLRNVSESPSIALAHSARMNEHQVKLLLSELGLPTIPEEIAEDEAGAIAAAARVGFPVALKILSADIAHKTEVGGVKLNLTDAQQVQVAFREVIDAAHRKAPLARIDGVLVQPMSRCIAELIVGITHDPVFGAALTVGLGGVLTELYGDVCHRLLPIDEVISREMLNEMKAFPLLDGFRGMPKADVDAACAAIAALSRAAQRLAPSVRQIEINPLQVRERGAGVAVLDALILGAPPS